MSTAIVDRHAPENQQGAPHTCDEQEVNDTGYCGVCDPEPCWECGCEDGMDCVVNPPADDIRASYVDINGKSVAGMLPLFDAPTLDILHMVIAQAIADGVMRHYPAQGVTLVEMERNQDVTRFLEIGAELQAQADAYSLV